MTLDFSPLENAVARLEEGLARHLREPADAQLRNGLVKRFEFTYELSHRSLKRHLEQASATPGQFDALPFADLIRAANVAGFLRGDWPTWRRFREMCGKTSHTYREDVALEVVAGIGDFLAEAIHLRDELKKRSA